MLEREGRGERFGELGIRSQGHACISGALPPYDLGDYAGRDRQGGEDPLLHFDSPFRCCRRSIQLVGVQDCRDRGNQGCQKKENGPWGESCAHGTQLTRGATPRL